MNKIKATIYKTDGSHEPVLLSSRNSLKTLQKLVGGRIDIIHILDFKKSMEGDTSSGNDLVINDEGLDLPINPWSQIFLFYSIWEDEKFRGDIVLIEGRLP